LLNFMIYYISSIGIANPWVVNEVASVEKYLIPVVLHSLHFSKQALFFSSDWVENIIGWLQRFVSAILAPFLFRGRVFNDVL
jgi:hypothetical protein